jgi:hypothetical protein
MKRTILRLVMKNHLGELSRMLPPSAQPQLPYLEAQFIAIIDALPEGGGPSTVDVDVTKLDEGGIRACLEWMYKTLSEGTAGNSFAQLACQFGRALGLQTLASLSDSLLQPVKTLDNQGTAPGSKSR